MTWTENDRIGLQIYDGETNSSLKKLLISRIPELEGTTVEEVALSAKKKEGFELAISTINDCLAAVQEQPDLGELPESL